MVLRSGITPSRAQGAIRNVGIKSGLAAFKATALPTVLAFWPLTGSTGKRQRIPGIPPNEALGGVGVQ